MKSQQDYFTTKFNYHYWGDKMEENKGETESKASSETKKETHHNEKHESTKKKEV